MAARLSIMAVEARVQVPLCCCLRNTSSWLISSRVAAMADGTIAASIKTVSTTLRIRFRIQSLLCIHGLSQTGRLVAICNHWQGGCYTL